MILLMGIAGSGKGTQGKMLADKYGCHLLSMGEILRMYLTGSSRESILSGNLLGDKDIIEIVDKVLSSIPDKEEIIFDGFPRTIPQAEWLLTQAKSGRFELRLALHLVASREAVKERLIKRARIDDNEASIEKRFSEYENSTMPIIKWLKEHGVAVYNVNAEQSVEDVNKELISILSKA